MLIPRDRRYGLIDGKVRTIQKCNNSQGHYSIAAYRSMRKLYRPDNLETVTIKIISVSIDSVLRKLRVQTTHPPMPRVNMNRYQLLLDVWSRMCRSAEPFPVRASTSSFAFVGETRGEFSSTTLPSVCVIEIGLKELVFFLARRGSLQLPPKVDIDQETGCSLR